MVEDDEAVVKAHVKDGEFEVVDGVLREAGFDELLEIVAPIAEAAAERKWEVELVEEFVAGDKRIQEVPRVAIEFLRAEAAMGAKGGELEEWTYGDKGIARLGRIEELAAQQHEAKLAEECVGERLRCVLGADF